MYYYMTKYKYKCVGKEIWNLAACRGTEALQWQNGWDCDCGGGANYSVGCNGWGRDFFTASSITRFGLRSSFNAVGDIHNCLIRGMLLIISKSVPPLSTTLEARGENSCGSCSTSHSGLALYSLFACFGNAVILATGLELALSMEALCLSVRVLKQGLEEIVSERAIDMRWRKKE